MAGRVVLKRDMGKLQFLTLRDRDGDLQLVCDRTLLAEEAFALLDEVDLGDRSGPPGSWGPPGGGSCRSSSSGGRC